MPLPDLPPWADAVATAYDRADESIWCADLGQSTPAAALSDRLRIGHWKLMPYDLADGMAGRMVWTGPEAGAPELALPLPARGPHAVFVGLFGGGMPCQVRLRLASQAVGQVRAVGQGLAWNRLEEVFHQVADLGDDRLFLAPEAAGCGVAYVRLVPLSQREGEAWRRERSAPRTRLQAATHDGLGILYNRPARDATVASLLQTLEGFRDTGFGTLLLQYGGADQVPYPSAVASRFGAWADEQAYPENPGHRLYAESYRAFARAGVNPYQVLIEGAHALGMAVQVSVRPAMWTFWEPYSDFFESPFFRDHPEWRTVDRDGTPVTRMSWAVPQVRSHVVAVLQEAVQLGADGVNVLFNRGMPVVLFEPAFVELFARQYGRDPRDVEEADPRITQARSDIIAAFMRQVRHMLADEARRRQDGRGLVLSASCFGNQEDNLHFGLDVQRLVVEGLVDEVYPYKWDHLDGAGRRAWDIAAFSSFCRPHGVRLSPVLTSGYEFDTQVQDALAFRAQGADSVSYWDAAGMWRDMGQWSVMSRMDRPEELAARQARGPTPGRAFVQLRTVNGQVVNGRYPPYMGG